MPHSSAQTTGLWIGVGRVSQGSEGQSGAGRVSFSRPPEFRGLLSLQSSGSSELSAQVKFEANFSGAADSTDAWGSNRKELQEQTEDAPLLSKA